ncbi:MAG TPA: hypothetical protein VLH84_05660 [Patescibacteria group bacterium]|nr:hypothetical protein [Patescibacteria group bacterium]
MGIYETTATRLQGYPSAFDPEVIDSAARATAVLDGLSFKEVAARYGFEDGPATVVPSGTSRPVQYLELLPPASIGTLDQKSARVLYLPMGTNLGQDTALRAAYLFAADPNSDERLIVVGNPGRPGHGTGTVAREDLGKLWQGDLAPMVCPTLAQLGDMGIRRATMLGYSLGADESVAASQHAHDYNIETPTVVAVEPGGTQACGLLGVANNFRRSARQLHAHVALNKSQAYAEARRLPESSLGGFALGLGRATNIAIAHGLGQGRFMEHVGDALAVQQGMHIALGYGTRSEVVDSWEFGAAADKLFTETDGRVLEMGVVGMPHAGGDYLPLHAALMLEGMRLANAPRP